MRRGVIRCSQNSIIAIAPLPPLVGAPSARRGAWLARWGGSVKGGGFEDDGSAGVGGSEADISPPVVRDLRGGSAYDIRERTSGSLPGTGRDVRGGFASPCDENESRPASFLFFFLTHLRLAIPQNRAKGARRHSPARDSAGPFAGTGEEGGYLFGPGPTFGQPLRSTLRP